MIKKSIIIVNPVILKCCYCSWRMNLTQKWVDLEKTKKKRNQVLKCTDLQNLSRCRTVRSPKLIVNPTRIQHSSHLNTSLIFLSDLLFTLYEKRDFLSSNDNSTHYCICFVIWRWWWNWARQIGENWTTKNKASRQCKTYQRNGTGIFWCTRRDSGRTEHVKNPYNSVTFSFWIRPL